jgi:hypothetical protein
MNYREVETLQDPDGIVAVITQRMDTGYHSFRLQKEYVDRGQVKHTSYFGRRHCDAVIRLTKKVSERIDILDDQFRVTRARHGYSRP